MSGNHYEALLQECLAAYEHGLTPEECLSAFPQHRGELEPLLRQALALRIAFAAAPREGFTQQLRQRLLFAAGREASQAFSTEPHPIFVEGARSRLLEAAGAPAQEALRAVPPPRLPFWVNARRRLLEHASMPRTNPAPRPASLALQRGLSFAVLLIAVAVAGFAYIASQSNPPSVNAELASLEHDLIEIEAQAAAGAVVSPAELIDLSKRTTELVGRLDDAQSPLVAQKLPNIIERQKDVVTLVAGEGLAPAQLREAQQELTEAEAMLSVLAQTQQEAPPTVSQPLFPPTATAAPATPQSSATATGSAVLEPGQISIAPYPSDTIFGLSWTEVRTTGIRFVVPSSWKVVGVTTTQNVGTLDSDLVRFDGPDVIVIVNVATGEVNALVGGQAVQLRDEGKNGAVISVVDLLAIPSGQLPALYHHADSVELLTAPTPTPSPTATPPPSPTATSSATPEPAATNTVVP